jgi:hypothetical protein
LTIRNKRRRTFQCSERLAAEIFSCEPKVVSTTFFFFYYYKTSRNIICLFEYPIFLLG